MLNYIQILNSLGVETRVVGLGEWASMLCPFHDDTSPSGQVSVKRGTFMCFGCHEHATFERLYHQLTGEQLSILDDIDDSVPLDTQTDLDILSGFVRKDEDLAKRLSAYSRESFHRLYYPVRTSREGSSYLKSKRKLNSTTWKKFDLRWGISGVMKHRVVFPIYNEIGKLISYGGRTTRDAVPKTRKVRSAKSTLYGLHEALLKSKRNRLPYVIIVEGEFDAMYLQQCGYIAVASMGTSRLTVDQEGLVYSWAKRAFVSYDEDEAGIDAAELAIEYLSDIVPTDQIRLPSGKDPNDLSATEVEKLYKIVKTG